ncbi:MAG: tetratricopeptide repeat protein [candidate division NC10 bacterium]
MLNLNQGARAETVLKKAVELDPKYLLARRNLGRALLKNGKAALAVEEFEECLRLQPDDAPSQKYLQEAKTALAKSKRSSLD